MRLKITEKNHSAISEELSRVNARVRNVFLDDVLRAVEEVERKLSGLLHKKDWSGIVVAVDRHAQAFPASYRGVPESTKFTLERDGNSWFITDVRRGVVRRPTQAYHITGLEEKAHLLAEFAVKNFTAF